MNKIISKYLVCVYHPRAELVEHYKTGDIICTECGLVLTERNDIQEYSEIKKELIGITAYSFWKKSVLIRDICDRLHLCDVITEDAIFYFKQCFANKALRSLKKNFLAASAIYNSAKYHHFGILPSEIEAASGIPRFKITSYSEKMCDKLKLKIYPLPPESFITKFRYFLNMDFEDEKLSVHIIKVADDLGLVFTHNSEHVAAVTLYITSLIMASQKTVDEFYTLCNITNTTFEIIYDKLIKNINQLVPEKYVIYIHYLPKKIN